MKRAVAISAWAAAWLLPAQPTPKFEVASIRQCTDADHPLPAASSPGRLTLNCWPLRRIVLDAYELFAGGSVDPLNPAFPLTPMEGGPEWLDSARYTIRASTEGPQSIAMMRGPIMQKLLEDRFRLQMHRETREVAVYVLTAAPGGPKLKPTGEGSCNTLNPLDPTQSLKVQPGGTPWCVITPPLRQESKWVWDVKGMSLKVLVSLLHLGRPVIDRTGLTGAYDIHLEWWRNDGPPPDSGVPADPLGGSFVEAIRKQLGLRLEPGKRPVEFLVIDRLERPSEN